MDGYMGPGGMCEGQGFGGLLSWKEMGKEWEEWQSLIVVLHPSSLAFGSSLFQRNTGSKRA